MITTPFEPKKGWVTSISMDDALRFNGETAGQLACRFERYRSILVWGEMGVGKSTLTMALGRSLAMRSGRGRILSLDPGTPPFGIPGAVCVGRWHDNTFEWGDCQALCTLDASRFRVPVILAARRLLSSALKEGNEPVTVIDPPGVTRGVGGAELLTALIETLHVDGVIVLYPTSARPPLSEELSALPVAVHYIPAALEAKRPARQERYEHRTALWDRFLSESVETPLSLSRVHVLGTPPPRHRPEAWAGRQAGLLDQQGETLQMGEIIRLEGPCLTVKVPWKTGRQVSAILIRDAGRNAAGKIGTIPRTGRVGSGYGEPVEMTAPEVRPETGQRPISSRLGPAWATLVGGVLGDPLLHVRFRNLKQSLFFDLGDPSRLAARVAHQVTGVFLSHAHLDHIGGFIWFLRSRIGPFGSCRIFGPAETIARIENFLGAITWDRIEENAPVFEVCEIDDSRLRRVRLRPGHPRVMLPDVAIENGIIIREDTFRIRAVVCDHNIPSVAYALMFPQEICVRKERLSAFGLRPGPWLGQMKQAILSGNPQTRILLPTGETRRADQLAEALTIIRPGKKLVYAADMADTAKNRRKLVDLARSAHTFFCETAFAHKDKPKADATQHLTTLAAVDIACQAQVERLAPFHFSKRYEHQPGMIYDEIRSALPADSGLKVVGGFFDQVTDPGS